MQEIPLEIGREICSYFENNEMNPEIFDDVSPEIFNQTEKTTNNNFTSTNIGNLSFNQEAGLPLKNDEEKGGDTNNLFGGFDNFAIEPAPKSLFYEY